MKLVGHCRRIDFPTGLPVFRRGRDNDMWIIIYDVMFLKRLRRVNMVIQYCEKVAIMRKKLIGGKDSLFCSVGTLVKYM
jgi:hypothetical protein